MRWNFFNIFGEYQVVKDWLIDYYFPTFCFHPPDIVADVAFDGRNAIKVSFLQL